MEGEKTRVNGALYFFGYGLSYTTFAYSNLRNQSASSFRQCRQGSSLKVTITCDVTNSGTREGDEVVQLYTHELVTSCHHL